MRNDRTFWILLSLGVTFPAVVSTASASPAAPQMPREVIPTMQGDANLDWSIDTQDLQILEAVLGGPCIPVSQEWACLDYDHDGDIDLQDIAAFQTSFTGEQYMAIDITDDLDDGTEINGATWAPNGPTEANVNFAGRGPTQTYAAAFRFHVPKLTQGEEIAFARLLLPVQPDGQVDSQVRLRVFAIDADGVAPFDVQRPSQLPRTAEIAWDLSENWPIVPLASDCYPLERSTPDLAALINAVLARPDWGTGEEGKTIALVLDDNGSDPTNYVAFGDLRNVQTINCPYTSIHPRLELHRTVRSTFVGREMLGRPTDKSVTFHAMALLPINAFIEYGPASGNLPNRTATLSFAAGSPIEFEIGGLQADSTYYYRFRYRHPSKLTYESGPERRFVTQRAIGKSYTFTLTSDSHLFEKQWDNNIPSQNLYRTVLKNALNDSPDFHIDLGDTFLCESYNARDAVDEQECIERHLLQRPFLDLLCHSAPFFFALGNHEGEQGWRLNGTPDNLAVWATKARKLVYPLPSPDLFYSGNTQNLDYVGQRENYYAWQWGDALFVVLDPLWNTTSKPHEVGPAGSGDNWDWTLGQTQYNWFVQTLASSTAKFKFVFSHHVVGGVSTYARGGIEAAKHSVGGVGSFEWGGENLDGAYAFNTKRPGWGLPIHDIMNQYDVSIFFHGHDHVFVKQDLDGIVYQECPQPTDPTYGPGFYVKGQYAGGIKVNNSGHLRVRVTGAHVQVDYVRAYLSGQGDNGEVGYTYTVLPPGS